MNLLHVAPEFVKAYNTDYKTEIEFLIGENFNYRCAEAFTNLIISKSESLRETVVMMHFVKNEAMYNKNNREEFRR